MGANVHNEEIGGHSQEKKEKESFWTVNREVLPFKIHFFLFCGALSGVLPFKTVFSRSKLGLRARDIAVLFTSQQFVAVVSKTVIGLLVDYLNKLKFAMIAISLLQALFYLSLLLVPGIQIPKAQKNDTSHPSSICLTKWSSDVIDSQQGCCLNPQAKDYEYCAVDLNCLMAARPTSDILSAASCYDSNCSVACLYNATISDMSIITSLGMVPLDPENSSRKELVNEFLERKGIRYLSYFELNAIDIALTEEDSKYYYKYYAELDEDMRSLEVTRCEYSLFLTSSKESCDLFSAFFHNSSSKDFHQIESTNHDESDARDKITGVITYEVTGDALYSTYQYWIFIALFLCAGLCSNAMFTMSDTACHEVLQKTGSDYGKQRAWGAVSWGLLAPACGLLNDFATRRSGHPDYSPGFYINFILTVVLVLNISRLDLVKPDMSKNIWKDIRNVFRSRELVVFETGVFVTGMFTGTLWCYLMIYLESIGGSKFLLGLVHTCQCFLGEVPLMFMSGWIIRKIGHFNVLSLTFLAFTIRFTCYHFLTNPWYVFPIEMLHGWTYGVFYACMTSYAKLAALPGAEATTQSVFCVTYEGLGAGVGCIITGLIYDHFGGRETFLICAVCSLLALIWQMIANYCLKSRTKTVNLNL